MTRPASRGLISAPPSFLSGPLRFSGKAGPYYEGQPAYGPGAYQGRLITVCPNQLGDVIPLSASGNTRIGGYDVQFLENNLAVLGAGGPANASIALTVGSTANDRGALIFNGGLDTGVALMLSLPFTLTTGGRAVFGAEISYTVGPESGQVWVGLGNTVTDPDESQANFLAVNVRGNTQAPQVQSQSASGGVVSTEITPATSWNASEAGNTIDGSGTATTTTNYRRFTMGAVVESDGSITGHFEGYSVKHVAALPVGALTLQVALKNIAGAPGSAILVHRMHATQEIV